MVKEIISRFKEQPKSKTAWWATGLGIATIIAGVRAFKQGERSWVLWLVFIPAILNGALWIFMIIGEFIFPH